MIPSLKQWKKWSLPNKATYVGTVLACIGVIMTVFFGIKSLTKKVPVLRGCVVNHGNDWPIEGAKVTVVGRGEYIFSDTSGNFILELQNTPRDFRARLHIEKERFYPWEGYIIANQAKTIRLRPIKGAKDE